MKEATAPRPVWRVKRRRLVIPKGMNANRLFLYAATLLVGFMTLCALFPQWIAPYSPGTMNLSALLQPPGADHLLGTDYFGRDVFSLIVYGARDSLLIGVASVLVGGGLGGFIGALSGYAGGVVDVVIMRFVEVLMSIPSILLALAIAAAVGPSLFNVVLAVAAALIPNFARVMRSQILTIKNKSYVLASHSMGSSGIHIFLKHILPNSLAPFLVMTTVGVGTSILTSSGLSFLGLGVIKEIPDWGTVLAQGRGYLTVAWWICTFPGLAIALFVLSINVMGDSVRDTLDPRKYSR